MRSAPRKVNKSPASVSARQRWQTCKSAKREANSHDLQNPAHVLQAGKWLLGPLKKPQPKKEKLTCLLSSKPFTGTIQSRAVRGWPSTTLFVTSASTALQASTQPTRLLPNALGTSNTAPCRPARSLSFQSVVNRAADLENKKQETYNNKLTKVMLLQAIKNVQPRGSKDFLAIFALKKFYLETLLTLHRLQILTEEEKQVSFEDVLLIVMLTYSNQENPPSENVVAASAILSLCHEAGYFAVIDEGSRKVVFNCDHPDCQQPVWKEALQVTRRHHEEFTDIRRRISSTMPPEVFSLSADALMNRVLE